MLLLVARTSALLHAPFPTLKPFYVHEIPCIKICEDIILRNYK